MSSNSALAQPVPPDPLFAGDFDVHTPPIADAGLDQDVAVGTAVTLDGSASSDPDGDALTYQWRVVSRPANSSADVFDQAEVASAFVPDKAGDYVVELVVSDGEFESAPSAVTITASGTLPASAVIGPAGGGVGLPDGAAALIPPGALASPVTIAIASIGPPGGAILPPTAVYVGDVYALTPQGQAFAKPVQIIVPYDVAMLPGGYEEGAIAIYRQENWPEFDMVGEGTDEDEPESSGQYLNVGSAQVSVHADLFSAYAAVAVMRSAQFAPTQLMTTHASIEVRRPPIMRTQQPLFNCEQNGISDHTQVNLMTRSAASITSIVIHSTNNGQAIHSFENELGWATNDCNKYFAHYYINRDGSIYQVADDLIRTNHVNPNQSFGITNSSAIGIELFDNVGEPYDGRQISALIRLIDFLTEKYTIVRLHRDVVAGIFRRNRGPINSGGDRFVGHADIDTSKCDPSGTFFNSGEIKTEDVRFIHSCHDAPTLPLPGGDSRAPALMDLVLDTVTVLDRNGQHTGIVNTQGGDAFDVAHAGDAGAITFIEDASAVAARVGTEEQTSFNDHHALIVAPNTVVHLDGAGAHTYTDVIVAGTLDIAGPIELDVTGSFYVSPIGKIIARDGSNGADITVYSRGVPVIQGLIDARGEDGPEGAPADGGTGGNVTFTFAAPGILLMPTAYARGGDADTADISVPGGGTKGGNGGMVSVTVDKTHVIIGGGAGPLIADATVPPWRSGIIDPLLFGSPSRWSGDYLPLAPPFTLSSLTGAPAAGERKPLRTSAAQPGFARGILTTGGMGGVGLASSDANQDGGPAGDGGDISIDLGANGVLTFRDADLTTGSEVETVTHRFVLPPPAPSGEHLVCTVSGAHGGFGMNYGSHGGNGGAGGAAGAITIAGGVLNPSPSAFVPLYTIKGFPAGQNLQQSDDNCSTGSVGVGSVVEARDASGQPLYRVRLDAGGTALLGGLGGIPSGRAAAGNPGNVGAYGGTAPISGLPVH